MEYVLRAIDSAWTLTTSKTDPEPPKRERKAQPGLGETKRADTGGDVSRAAPRRARTLPQINFYVTRGQ